MLDKDFADVVAQLWKDKGIQKTYSMRNRYQLSDSADYFLGKVHSFRRTILFF